MLRIIPGILNPTFLVKERRTYSTFFGSAVVITDMTGDITLFVKKLQI